MAVAENLNFSKAAKELFISQPAVTKHIKELETTLNTPLFTRKGNRVQLTKAGLLVYSQYKQIKNKYDELSFEIGRLEDKHRGVLKIGASSTIAQYYIPNILALFNLKYPDIKLTLFNGNSFDMEQKLLKNEIDLALVENYSSNKDIKYLSFENDEIVAIVGKNSPLFKRRNIRFEELTQFPLVLREKGSGTLEYIEEELNNKNIDISALNVFIYLGSTESIKNFLIDFNGIGLVSNKSITKEIELNLLRKIEIDDFKLKRKFRTAVLHGHQTSLIELFLNFLNSSTS